jgi:hypothetical protein
VRTADIEAAIAVASRERRARDLGKVEQLLRLALDDDVAADQRLAKLRQEHPGVQARLDATVDALQSIRAAARSAP